MNQSMAVAMKEAEAQRSGMSIDDNQAQIDKAHNAQLQEDDNQEALDTTGAVGDAPVLKSITHTFLFDSAGKVLPSSFKEGIQLAAPKAEAALLDFVDNLTRRVWSDLFRIANMTTLEWGVQPGFGDRGRAVEVCYAPEMFAFDKDTSSYSEVTETQGVVQPMTPTEVAAEKAKGKRAMTNSGFQFYIETTERVLEGLAILHTFKDLGYSSGLVAEDLWKAASESELKRRKSWQERQELEGLKREQNAKEALSKLTAPGGVLDL